MKTIANSNIKCCTHDQKSINMNIFKRRIDDITKSVDKRNKRKDFEINVNKDDLYKMCKSQNFKCALSGLPLCTRQNCIYSLSPDRIDSDIGYTLNNLQIVTKHINFLKHIFTQEEARFLINELKNRYRILA